MPVELGSQGAWTKWDLRKWKITWPEIWRLEPFHISFLPSSVYDTLPSPTNLHRWGVREDPLCRLSGGRGTMAHILADTDGAMTRFLVHWLTSWSGRDRKRIRDRDNTAGTNGGRPGYSHLRLGVGVSQHSLCGR